MLGTSNPASASAMVSQTATATPSPTPGTTSQKQLGRAKVSGLKYFQLDDLGYCSQRISPPWCPRVGIRAREVKPVSWLLC